jgi:hypothetical protein
MAPAISRTPWSARFSAAPVPFQAAHLTCKATRFRDRASGGSAMTLKKKLAAALAAAGLAAGLSLAGAAVPLPRVRLQRGTAAVGLRPGRRPRRQSRH